MGEEKPKRNVCEKFEIIKIHRKEIKNASYNPRKIKQSAKKKLEENLNTVGLLDPIVWNKTTGNILSGHQRLSICDKLNETKEYLVTVSAVELDEKTEKEQNIFMNNKDAQGAFDFDKLKIMHEDIDIIAAGFETIDIFKFTDDITKEEDKILSELSEKLREIERQRQDKKDAVNKRENTNFYCVFVFENNITRLRAMERLGLSSEIYHDGRETQNLIRLD